MQQSYIIGVDIGTGSVKAVALHPDGSVFGTQKHSYSFVEQEQNEQEVDAVFGAFQKCVRELIALIDRPPSAISLSCTMHSILAVDKQGKPLNKAMLWSDTRGMTIAEALRESKTGKDIYLATGTPLHAMSPLCKLKWMVAEQSDLFHRAHKVISIKEYVWWRLFGEYKVDHSIASATGLFNIHKLQWEERALSFIPLSNDRLSEPVPVTYVNNNLSAEMASALGVATATPFCIGASDGCLANLGTLCLEPSTAAITIGTSAAVRITRRQPMADPGRMFFNYLLGDYIVCGGAVNNGGNVVQWLLENFLLKKMTATGYDEIYKEINNIPAGAEGLIFLPYLNGERAPVWDEKSCGVFLGVRAAHTQTHFARAAVEGLCFALNEILANLEKISGPVEQIRLSGGITASAVLVQMLADVTGKPVLLQQQEDASAIGAGYLVLKALNFISDFESIKMPGPSITKPQKNIAESYKGLFAVYQNIYPGLKNSMHLLHQFNSRK